jgi:hypothetical protein
LTALQIKLDTNAEFDDISAAGQEFSAGEALRREWTTGSLDGVPTYTELAYVLSNKFGAATITSLGGSPTAYKWVWNRTGLVWPTPKTFTVERGVLNSGDPIDVATYFMINNLTLDFSRTAAQKIGGSCLAQALNVTSYYPSGDATYTLTAAGTPPSSGTFTLTVAAQTTSAIAFGATAAAVQAALEALSTVGTGNVKVTATTATGGGTLAVAANVYTVEFVGALAQTAVTMTGTFTGLTPSGSIALAAGVSGAAPTALALVPLLAGQIDVFMDPTAAALGTTKYTRDFIAHFETGRADRYLLAPQLGAYELRRSYVQEGRLAVHADAWQRPDQPLDVRGHAGGHVGICADAGNRGRPSPARTPTA